MLLRDLWLDNFTGLSEVATTQAFLEVQVLTIEAANYKKQCSRICKNMQTITMQHILTIKQKWLCNIQYIESVQYDSMGVKACWKVIELAAKGLAANKPIQ